MKCRNLDCFKDFTFANTTNSKIIMANFANLLVFFDLKYISSELMEIVAIFIYGVKKILSKQFLFQVVKLKCREGF